MRMIALVMDYQKDFIKSKTNKVEFVSSLKEMQKKIDSGIKAQFILSEGLVYLEDDFKRFVRRNSKTTFIIYTELEDHIWHPTAYLKDVRNYVGEPINAEELVGLLSGKIIFETVSVFWPGEIRLKKVK